MALRGASGGYDRGMRGASPVTTGRSDPVPEKCHSAISMGRTGDITWGTPSEHREHGGKVMAGPVPIRGYLKIEGAARAFGFDFKDKTVLDIGSSTGGFTEYALEHGARKVIAVEKGSHQMKAPLRFDPRIELHEKTDIFDFTLEKEIDTVVADVSFLSLTKVLAYLKNIPNKNTNFLMMLKPQFEASPKELRNGVVKNETIRRQIIKRFESWLKQNGYIVIKKHDNTLHGKTGNIERFYYFKLAK